MTTTELEVIADEIRAGYQLRSERIGAHVKLLRSIEIAALREARELVEEISTDPERPGWRVVEDVASARKQLENNIRQLELR